MQQSCSGATPEELKPFRKGDNFMNNLMMPDTIKSVTALLRCAVLSCGLLSGTVYAETPPDTASPQQVPAEHQAGEGATTWDKTKEVSADTWDATKEGSAKAWDKTKEVSGDSWDATKEGSAKAWDKTKEMTGGSPATNDEPVTGNQEMIEGSVAMHDEPVTGNQ
jgi:hypothetical protein